MRVSHHFISLYLSGFMWKSCMISCIHRYNHNHGKMGDICKRRNSLLLLLLCLYVSYSPYLWIADIESLVACCWPKNSTVVQATLGYRTRTHTVSRCVLMHCNQKLGFLLCWDFSTFSSFLLILWILEKRPILFPSLALLGCELKVTLIHKRPLRF